ncbi:hypothetical protein FACS189468_5120 [Spirochaetia bacterium]|nr:hypothetical protein FACS189468_5120 [Spirochaetia bacterium]
MKEQSKADHRLVFLSVPESLRDRLITGHDHGPDVDHVRAPDCDHDFIHDHDSDHDHDDFPPFSIDPEIPIPVELAPEEPRLDLEELSWEMILLGMIRVIAALGGNNLGVFTFGENSTLRSPREIKPEWIDYYRRFVLAVKPALLSEWTEAGILKAKNGDYEMALEIFTLLEGLFPQSPVTLLNRALILEEQADAQERVGRETEAETQDKLAREAYEKLLAMTPPFPDGLFNAGFFYMKRRDFNKARECFAAYLALEEVRLPPEKQERARKLAEEITRNSLDDEVFREAYELIRLGEEEKGILKVRDFLERHPEVWNGWFILGWGLRRLGRWEDGAACFEKALDLGGDNGDTRNELAICLMETGDFPAARGELELALREEPENVKIISNLGVLALKTGDDDLAAGFFRTVLELEPEDPVAKGGLEALTGNHR